MTCDDDSEIGKKRFQSIPFLKGNLLFKTQSYVNYTSKYLNLVLYLDYHRLIFLDFDV